VEPEEIHKSPRRPLSQLSEAFIHIGIVTVAFAMAARCASTTFPVMEPLVVLRRTDMAVASIIASLKQSGVRLSQRAPQAKHRVSFEKHGLSSGQQRKGFDFNSGNPRPTLH